MTESEQGAGRGSRTPPPGEPSPRRTLAGLAIASALSLAIPAAFFVLTIANAGAGPYEMSTARTLATVGGLGAVYIILVLRARTSGPAIVAGVSTSLGVVGVIALVLALLLAKLNAMLGGSGSAGLVFAVLVFAAAQFGIARGARALAGKSRRMRGDAAYHLGIAIPVLFLIGISAVRAIPRRLEVKRYVADAAARERARSDLFALHACASAHRARDPRHEWPASLKALGSEGDKCLRGEVIGGRDGWRFEYAASPATADSVAGFTARATPTNGGETATVLTIDEQGVIREDWLNATREPLFRQAPPALDMLIALRACERDYRQAHLTIPASLAALHTLAASSRATGEKRCGLLDDVASRLGWRNPASPDVADEWVAEGYRVTFRPRFGGDSSVVAWEARPVTYGATGIVSYLALSSGATYVTTEPRGATPDDAVIPRCEFGKPPAGAAQCVPGSSPPPDATLAVDSVVDATGFTVSLLSATDSSAEGTAAGFQYAFSCNGRESDDFVKDSLRTCRAPWSADSVEVVARIRNRDLAVRNYTRRVRVKHPRPAATLTSPKPIVLGDVLELDARDPGRDPHEQIDYTIRIGDAPAETRSFAANRALFHCRAVTSQQSSDCSYPAKPGRYEVHLTVRTRNGDSATAIGHATISSPELLRLPPSANGTAHTGSPDQFLVLELLVDWPAEHGQTRLVSEALGAGDIGPEPPRIGSVEGVYPERAERASDGRTVVPIGFRWSELKQSGTVVPGMRELVLEGRRGHVHDFVPYRQTIAVKVEP